MFQESKCLLGTFFCLVLILFIVVGAGAIAGFVMGSESILDKIKTGLQKSMNDYNDKESVQKSWNFLQENVSARDNIEHSSLPTYRCRCNVHLVSIEGADCANPFDFGYKHALRRYGTRESQINACTVKMIILMRSLGTVFKSFPFQGHILSLCDSE